MTIYLFCIKIQKNKLFAFYFYTGSFLQELFMTFLSYSFFFKKFEQQFLQLLCNISWHFSYYSWANKITIQLATIFEYSSRKLRLHLILLKLFINFPYNHHFSEVIPGNRGKLDETAILKCCWFRFWIKISFDLWIIFIAFHWILSDLLCDFSILWFLFQCLFAYKWIE